MHLVEISTKSTKNMGYAQVTQFDEEIMEIIGNEKEETK